MGAAILPDVPRRPTLLRRLLAAFALTVVLLLGAMSNAAAAAPRTGSANRDLAPSAQALPNPRPPAFVLPLVLGAIVFLAALPPVFPRFVGGGRT